MAQTNYPRSVSTSNYAIHHVLMTLFGLLMLTQNGNGYQFKVGGPGTWSPPSDPNSNNYNQWAEKSRFQIGDSLLFSYSGDIDSVLLVNKDDYDNCNTDNPVHKYTDGHTEFKFDHSGPHYFISGVKDHCLKNEKLLVVVMADRRNQSPSPSPSSSTSNGTAAPPPNNNDNTTTYSPPSPAPSGEEAPSPPAAVEINPTPAPSAEQSKPKKNGAPSSLVDSFFIAPLGAFVGSILLVVF